jgi:cell division protein ZapA
MAHVIVQINGQPYTMQCPDGEEEHLKELAQLLESEVVNIRRSVGSVGDIRILVMAGLMVADRLSEAVRKIEEIEDELRAMRESRAITLQQVRDLESRLAERLENASKRLELLAHEMGQAP